jgi:WhiB family transcriptional regulator, redox-sensing transcriptional regulator
VTRIRTPSAGDIAAARRDPRLRRALTQPATDVAWRARGACRSVDPEIFFPPANEPADTAVAYCRRCAVQAACLAWALQVEDRHGVWGATTPRERRAMQVIWRARRGGRVPVGAGDLPR